MDVLLIVACFSTTIFFILALLSQTTVFKRNDNLPPGKTGWPFIGETLSYFACPGDFIRHRMTIYSTTIFKTSFVGMKIVFLCGPTANKFIFSNEAKLFKSCLPDCLAKLLSQPNYPEHSELQSSWLLLDEPIHKFFKLDSILNHVRVMDAMARDHVDRYWVPFSNNELKVYPLAKEFTFTLACRVMLDYSDTNPEQIAQLAKQFCILVEGVLTMPVNFPGMPYYKAKKGGDKVREMVVDIVKQRRKEATTMSLLPDDLLGHLLLATQPNGRVFDDQQIASKIIGYLFGGFYTSSSAIAFLLCHLAEHPLVLEKVLQEQLQIAKERGPGKLMCWADVQKMKYSWNVVRESMRLVPPAIAGTFKEVISDFTYQGYTIPKGWKVYWATHTTNKDPKYFKDPEKFDPSRFEDEGPSPYTYVPFGGGPRMCKGNEYARVLLLVFLHNVVTRFGLEKINPYEKMYYNPDPIPAEGARILIRPLNL